MVNDLYPENMADTAQRPPQQKPGSIHGIKSVAVPLNVKVLREGKILTNRCSFNVDVNSVDVPFIARSLQPSCPPYPCLGGLWTQNYTRSLKPALQMKNTGLHARNFSKPTVTSFGRDFERIGSLLGAPPARTHGTAKMARFQRYY